MTCHDKDHIYKHKINLGVCVGWNKMEINLKVVSIVQARVGRTECWGDGRGYGGVGLLYAWIQS